MPRVGDEVEVVVRAGAAALARVAKRQRARHAQVQQQAAAASSADGSQRYLPRRAHRADASGRRSAAGVAAERPAQRLAHAHARARGRRAMRSAKLRRVTSTSGNSGMRGIIRCRHPGRGLECALARRWQLRLPLAMRVATDRLAAALPRRVGLRAAARAPAELPCAGRPAPPTAAENSALDAPLFYQLLLGELELRSGEPARPATQLMLDAARRTTRRSAVPARGRHRAAGARRRQALAAARAWRQAAARVARGAALPAADPGRAQPRRRSRPSRCAPDAGAHAEAERNRR